MKKQGVLLIVLSLLTFNVFAQETYLDIVLNYTPTSMSFGSNNDAIKDFKKGYWGLQAGASLQMGITDHFSIVPELYFVMKGTKLNANNPLTYQETRIRFNTLDMPVLVRLHLCDLYFNAGPVISYNIGGRVKTEGTETSEPKITKMSFGTSSLTYSRWDAGLQFGLGYEIQLKKSRLVVDFRYHYGMVDMGNGTELYNRYVNMNILLAKKWKKNPLSKAKTKDLALWETVDNHPFAAQGN